MNPFNTARSDSHKTKPFKKVNNESFKQTTVLPVITGRFTIRNYGLQYRVKIIFD